MRLLKADLSDKGYSAELLYSIAGVSRQKIYRIEKQQKFFDKQAEDLLELTVEIREDHPVIGAREIYKRLKSSKQHKHLLNKIGRDKFEQLLFENGFRIHRRINKYRTTVKGAYQFPNLIEGMKIKALNKVWMSDITYLIIYKEVYYITSVMDVYSRRLLGYAVSDNMRAESTSIAALKMALSVRGIIRYKRLIFHTDGGGQYIDEGFLELLHKYHIASSMTSTVYENPFIERLNSTIKNDYLIPWKAITYEALQRGMPRLEHLYNNDRDHQSLKGLTPIEFEKRIKKMRLDQRPKMCIKKLEHK